MGREERRDVGEMSGALQARAMMADHNADKAEIRRMNAYVRTAKSIVGERSCDVKPIDLDRKDPGPLIL